MKNIKNLTIGTMAFVAFAAAAPASAASLIGQTVTTQLIVDGNNYGTVNSLVGNGPEGNFFGNQIFDYGADSFSIRSTSTYGSLVAGSAAQFVLTGLNFGTPITGVSFSTLLTGVTSSFTSNSVTFSFADQRLPAATYINATFQTAAVPEPATWALMILGMGAVGFAMRRRNNSATNVTVRFA